MKTSTASVDKKLEELADAIPPRVLKYFYLLSFVAGAICSLLWTAGLILIVATHRSWVTLFRGSESLFALAFFIWATREMFRAFRDVTSTGDRGQEPR